MSRRTKGPRSTRVLNLLRQGGFADRFLVDHRRKPRGSLWVVTGCSQDAHEDFFTRLNLEEGYDFQYSAKGSKATDRRAGWWWQPEVLAETKSEKITELPTIGDGPLTIKAHKLNLNVESLDNAEVVKSVYPDGEPDFLIVLRADDESQSSVVLHRVSSTLIKRLFRATLDAWVKGNAPLATLIADETPAAESNEGEEAT